MKKPPSSLRLPQRDDDSAASSDVEAPSALDDNENRTQLYQAPDTPSKNTRSLSPKKAPLSPEKEHDSSSKNTRTLSLKKAPLSPEKEHDSSSKLARAHTRHVVHVAV